MFDKQGSGWLWKLIFYLHHALLMWNGHQFIPYGSLEHIVSNQFANKPELCKAIRNLLLDLSKLLGNRHFWRKEKSYTEVMKFSVLFLMVVILLSACTAPQAGTPFNSLNDPENFNLLPSSEVTLAPNTPVLEQNSGPLTARIFSSQDATVNDGSYLIQGTANQEVVVTVNDSIFTSPPESVFSLTVDLEEGPNLIEIVISDLEGNEVNFTLTITYEP